jgi:hypothetical protein
VLLFVLSIHCGGCAETAFVLGSGCRRILSLNTTLIYRQNKLHVSATDGSHYQDDHKMIKRRCLRLHLWLEISNLTNAALYNIRNV